MVHYCPHCNTIFIASRFNTDIVHECKSGNAALDNEDVVVTGDWSDYSGSGSANPKQLQVAGTQNELQGTLAGHLGADKEELTLRGKRVSTHRTRPRLHYLEVNQNDGR